MIEINDKLNKILRTQMDGQFEENQEIRLQLIAQSYAICENAIAVLSNLRTDKSYIYFGKTSEILDIDTGSKYQEVNSIWEEEILHRIHPEDLKMRNLQELAFYHFISTIHSEKAFHWYLENTMRMCDKKGIYHNTRHRIFYFRGEGQRGISYALCLYNIIPKTSKTAMLVNTVTGERRILDVNKKPLLTERERNILAMIQEGLSSKLIAGKLKISKNTIDRHRQNIICKLQATNTTEACSKAKRLGLIE